MAAKRKRPLVVAVQLDEREKAEMKGAADQAGLALSVFVRLITLAAIRSGQTISAAKAA
jgi:hypothetical protein